MAVNRPVFAAVWHWRPVRRRGGLRSCADDGPGARPIWPVRRRGGQSFDSFFGPYLGAALARGERRSTTAARLRRRKPDVQPTGGSVLVLGDSMADWLAYGLEDALGDPPDLAVVRKNRASSGLIRYDSRNEREDWAQVIRETIAATKPKFVVMMVGLNDRVSIRDRVAQSTQPAGAAAKNARAARRVRPGTAGRLRPTQNPRPRTPSRRRANSPSRARAADQRRRHHHDLSRLRIPDRRMGRHLHQADRCDDRRAEKRRRAGVLGRAAVDPGPEIDERHAVSQRPLPRPCRKGRHQLRRVWDGFVDESGRFNLQGPDFEGQIRRLRASDGVHFTKAGARKLAHYVEREIRRVIGPGRGAGGAAVERASGAGHRRRPSGRPRGRSPVRWCR